MAGLFSVERWQQGARGWLSISISGGGWLWKNQREKKIKIKLQNP